MTMLHESIGNVLRRVDFNPEPEVLYNPPLGAVIKQDEYRAFIKAVHDNFRKLQNHMVDVDLNFRDLVDRFNQVEIMTPRIAMQFVQITADMLESSNDPSGIPVPRSVLTTASDTEQEFNWLLGGISIHASVSLGPGAGAVSHHVLVDLDDMNNPIQRKGASAGQIVNKESSVFRPYGMSGLKIQLCNIRADGNVLKVYPRSMSVGTFVQAVQILPPFNYK